MVLKAPTRTKAFGIRAATDAMRSIKYKKLSVMDAGMEVAAKEIKPTIPVNKPVPIAATTKGALSRFDRIETVDIL